MANNTRSSHRSEDEENNKGKLRRISENGPINSFTNVLNATGLRRSERLEKRTPPTVAIRRSERVEKQKMPSSLMRFGRSEKQSSLNTLGSKSSGSSGSEQNPAKEKSVKKLKFEANEVRKNEEHDVETSYVGIKRLDAFLYRDFFKKAKKDYHEEPIRTVKSTHDGGNNSGGKIDVYFKGSHLDCEELSKDGVLLSEDGKANEMRDDCRLSGLVKEISDNNVTLGSMVPSTTTTHETSGVPERVQSECCGDETLQKSESRHSILNEKLFRKSVWSNNCERKKISSKRKGTMVDLHSDVSATLVGDVNRNLISDAGNAEGIDGPCSKLIRMDDDPAFSRHSEPHNPSVKESQRQVHHAHDSVDRPDCEREDIANKRRIVINNVGQPSSKCEGQKFSTGNKKGKSGVSADRPQGDDIESEKIRKLCDEQRSLHLLLKPNIAKLCEILLLPDNVKSMVDNFLEYIMKNHHVNRESESILQAFQISLCWTAASLVKHKLDHKDSLMLAKQKLKFDCKKDEVDYIYSLLRCLKKIFLYRTGNFNVTGSSKASESSNREVELAYKDICKSIKKIEKKCQKELEKLLLRQQEEKQNLKAVIEKEKAVFEKGFETDSAAARTCCPNNVLTAEKLKVLNSEYDKGIEELKQKHEIRLRHLEDKQLVDMKLLQDKKAIWVEVVRSWARDELNIVASKELGTGIEYLQTCHEAQPYNGPQNVALGSDHVAIGRTFGNIDESITRTETGVALSEAPDTDSPAVVNCSSLVELQTPLVQHAGADETDIMASEDEPVHRVDSHIIAETEHGNQGNSFSNHSSSRGKNSDGAATMTVEGERSENCSHESRDGCREDMVLIFPSSNGDTCEGKTSDAPSGELVPAVCRKDMVLVFPSPKGDTCEGKTSDAPSGEVAPAVCKTSSFNDDQGEVPYFGQGKVGGTTLNKAFSGLSLGEPKGNGLRGSVENVAALNSLSPEKHTPVVSAMCIQNCGNAAEIHEADDGHGSNNADTLNSPLSNEEYASLNSKSPEEHAHNVNATDMPNCENPAHIHEAHVSTDSHNAVTLHSPLSEKIADGAVVSVLDRVARMGLPGTVHLTHCPENDTAMSHPSSMEQISGGVVNVCVLDVLSRPCGTASSSNGPHAVVTMFNQPSLEKQNPDRISSSMPAGQISVEVPESSHEVATKSELDRELPLGLPGAVTCIDNPENVTHRNSSSICQISDGGSLSIPDGQIPVLVHETSHELAGCLNDGEHFQDTVLVDKVTASNQQEGVHRTMTENASSQETLVSPPVEVMEPVEQMQLLSSVGTPPMHNLESDSCLQQVAVQDTSHLNPDSLMPGRDRSLSSCPVTSNLHGNEHRPANEDALCSHVPEPAIEAPNQAAVVQPASNLESNSCLHQVVVRPASNSLMSGGERTRTLDTRNLSNPLEINNHTIQTAAQSTCRIVLPLFSDPLKHELERIRKLIEQNMKSHEDMKLQLKSDYERELMELHRKYDIKRQESEAEFQQTKNSLDTNFKKVLQSKILADAFRYMCIDLKRSGESGMLQDSQQLCQFSRLQSATCPSTVASQSSCRPLAASLQTSTTTTASFQTTVLPVQTACTTSGIFSHVSARPPHINSIASPSTNHQASGEIYTRRPYINSIFSPSGNRQAGREIRASLPHVNSISSPSRNFQAGREIRARLPHINCVSSSGNFQDGEEIRERAPPPHLQPFRPSTSLPPSSLPTVMHGHGIPSQSALSSIPATSPSNSHRLRQLLPATYQSHRHRGHLPKSAGGLTTPNTTALHLHMDANNQSGINPPNVVPCIADVASLNPSKFGTNSSILANSAHQPRPSGVVCLSDDD